MADKWEYFTGLVQANADRDAGYIRERFPRYEFQRYNPIGLVPMLDELGAQGWEMISITPVVPRENDDLVIPTTATSRSIRYTNWYLCAFKRRVA
jgi:hypothetical protein